MSVIEINDCEALRAGDTATFAYRGHEFTGVVWDEKAQLFIGRTRVYDPHGGWSHGLDFVRATREVPDLPTAVGSVIEISVIGDTHLFVPVLAMLTAVDEWALPRQIEDRWAVAPYRITEWRPMKVVPA